MFKQMHSRTRQLQQHRTEGTKNRYKQDYTPLRNKIVCCLTESLKRIIEINFQDGNILALTALIVYGNAAEINYLLYKF